MGLPNTVIIAHGKTEKLLFEWIRSELKTNVVIDTPNGDNTVSMYGIRDVLMRSEYRDHSALHKKFKDLDYTRGRGGKGSTIPGLTIFPVLDVDGDRQIFKSYKSGDLLRSTPLGRHVVAIYNNPNLESVLDESGYGRVAHSTDAFQSFLDKQDVDDFRKRVASCSSTNMEILIDHMMGQCPGYQSRMNAARGL